MEKTKPKFKVGQIVVMKSLKKNLPFRITEVLYDGGWFYRWNRNNAASEFMLRELTPEEKGEGGIESASSPILLAGEGNMKIQKVAEGAYFVPSYSEQTIAWSPLGYTIQGLTFEETLEDTESVKKEEVMAKAVSCPVCGGSGKVPVDNVYSQPVTSTSGPQTRICHGCNGKGWVEVSSK